MLQLSLLAYVATAASVPVALTCTDEPADFVAEARLLQRVVACDGDLEVPAAYRAIVDAHCAKLRPVIDGYAAGYGYNAESFLARLQPPDLPTHVLYPFGGADLLSALTVYPFAEEITTISLELVGDPRRLEHANATQLAAGLDALRPSLILLLDEEAFSRSVNLSALQRGLLPSQLSFFLVGLATHGFEPVSLRYFHLDADGSTHYLSLAEIEALEATYARHLRSTWSDPDFSVAFANMELGFRRRTGPDTTPRVHRHIAQNLGDRALAADARLLSFLNRHGPYTAMTKAASYLLWMDGFGVIRDYLLANIDYMLSESSGIPPRFANPAGFTQDAYGRFERAYLAYPSPEVTREMRALWAAQPRIELPFRFGYPDLEQHNHLLVTYRMRPDWVPELAEEQAQACLLPF